MFYVPKKCCKDDLKPPLQYLKGATYYVASNHVFFCRNKILIKLLKLFLTRL